MPHFGKYSDKVGKQEHLVWRVRPFAGGQWRVFETTMTLLDWMIIHATPGSSYETQLVSMSREELEAIPVVDDV